MRKRIAAEFDNRWEGTIRNKKRQLDWAKSVMVQMPTGTGKTYVMAAAVSDFMMKYSGEVWIVAHRRELVDQTMRTLDRFGLNYAGQEFSTRHRIRVMSIQWLTRHYGDTSKKPGLIVIDEAHHSLANSYQVMWEEFGESNKLGFTATPCRLKTASFNCLFDVLLTSWNTDRFIAEGYLALYDYVVIGRNSEDQMIVEGLKKCGVDGDYSVPEMSSRLDNPACIGRLFDCVETYAKDKKGIVFAIDIAHAKNIAALYAGKGLRAVAIDSTTPAALREQLVEDFREGKLDCLVNVNLFDEGFDCPDVEYIQIARPTKSLSKYMQMVGRGLRIHPSKNLCIIIDNVGAYRIFGAPDRPREWEKMFNGLVSARPGLYMPKRPDGVKMDHAMSMVVNHSKEKNNYKLLVEDVKPYQVSSGKWGLSSNGDVVVLPYFDYISPFDGEYCAFRRGEHRWGILNRAGNIVIPDLFLKTEILPGGKAKLVDAHQDNNPSYIVDIESTLTDMRDIRKIWRRYKFSLRRLQIMNEMIHEQ